MWQLALGVLLHEQLSTTLAIVVERNTFAYYKVPLRMLDTGTSLSNSSSSGLFYILQCPPKLDDSIPKARDMQTCTVVDQYKDIWRKRPKSKKAARYQRYHRRPYRIMLRPLPPPTVRRMHWGWRQRRPKRHNQPSAYAATKSPHDEATPLQHLGQPHHKQKLLKLSADHRKSSKGSSTKGYQHMYHRDESYNDHIFYDELKLDGKFDHRGKTKTVTD
ncbi:hypothetical protein KR222_003136 [Zaprionus bogoriensis]|nr:hypothetical protein KR222_003136 [Zaprionus bogoriensis]